VDLVVVDLIVNQLVLVEQQTRVTLVGAQQVMLMVVAVVPVEQHRMPTVVDRRDQQVLVV
tara:strand:- start:722 stop:901 length:180 start_codon:yes stop_codon:yes gene_type:complete